MATLPATAADSGTKTPRTERGRRTMRALITAARDEFAEHGFHAAAISGITQRAGVALGSFYTYFDSKDAIFRALVNDMSAQVRDHVAPRMAAADGALNRERAGLEAFLDFAATHREIYRIIDEAEFVDPASWRDHYESTAARISQRLAAGVAAGDIRHGVGDVEAWAIMGMNVFLGLRFGVWEQADSREVARRANDLIATGLTKADDEK